LDSSPEIRITVSLWQADIKTLLGSLDLRPAKLFTLPSVFLDLQILDWHFMERYFLGNTRGRRRIRAEARVVLAGIRVSVKAWG